MTESISKGEALIVDDIKFIDTTIDIDLKQSIIDAILNNSMVKDEIKDSLKFLI